MLSIKHITTIHRRLFASKPRVKTGILMLNMGGPQTLDEVQPFLRRLFSDPDIFNMPFQSKMADIISTRRTPKVRQHYETIGGGSPIGRWTDLQGQAMTERLNEMSPETAPHRHYIGFRYAPPLYTNALEQMAEDGVERAVAFSQYPQYSCSTAGSSVNALFRYVRDVATSHGQSEHRFSSMTWSLIDRWPTHPTFINSHCELIKKELANFPSQLRDQVVLLFSAHSLPLRIVERGDPYPHEVAATVAAIMDRLGHANPYRIVWQSKVGPATWLRPATDQAIQSFSKRGYKNLLLIPIAFTSDHIETLHELDVEYCEELASKCSVENIRRVPALNDHPLFLEALSTIVKEHLDSAKVFNTAQMNITCPMCVNRDCSASRQWFRGFQPSIQSQKMVD